MLCTGNSHGQFQVVSSVLVEFQVQPSNLIQCGALSVEKGLRKGRHAMFHQAVGLNTIHASAVHRGSLLNLAQVTTVIKATFVGASKCYCNINSSLPHFTDVSLLRYSC